MVDLQKLGLLVKNDLIGVYTMIQKTSRHACMTQDKVMLTILS
jgi:hypothetical protein